jgi:hypothetical protein
MKASTFLISNMAIALLAVPAEAAKTRPAPPRADVTPFLAELQFGEQEELLRHGPLTLLATCEESAPTPQGALEHRVSLEVTSSVAEWDATSATDAHTRDGVFLGGLPAGVIRTLFLLPAPGNTTYIAPHPPDQSGFSSSDPAASQGLNFFGIGASAIAPTGEVLTVPVDSVGAGFRMAQIDSDADCLIHGLAFTYKGRIAR